MQRAGKVVGTSSTAMKGDRSLWRQSGSDLVKKSHIVGCLGCGDESEGGGEKGSGVVTGRPRESNVTRKAGEAGMGVSREAKGEGSIDSGDGTTSRGEPSSSDEREKSSSSEEESKMAKDEGREKREEKGGGPVGRTCEGVADIVLGGRGMQGEKRGVEGGAREHNKAAESCTRLAVCPSNFRLGKAGKACEELVSS
jgi:hypothetical protein